MASTTYITWQFPSESAPFKFQPASTFLKFSEGSLSLWFLLGDIYEIRRKDFVELSKASPADIKRRAKLQEAVKGTSHEFHGVGVEMNQRYESNAIFLQDEGPRPPLPQDTVLEHEITTYPSSRLPHAWLNTKLPGKQFSTIDLAGHRTFCLLTGIGGDMWKTATQKAAGSLGISINAYSIGWRQDYEDAILTGLGAGRSLKMVVYLFDLIGCCMALERDGSRCGRETASCFEDYSGQIANEDFPRCTESWSFRATPDSR
ncbi:uncharacterized protein PAC_08704 [Phialocephala subalpina]|uniref:Uncharacterized protein n=1 Tax=Phialocephala subalpina TaxID=576137 RepID=A0A1L7X1C0_9HELO|nr:uncharacterized protein PAC_08704 [Phialocephala subalpina]